MSGSVPDATNTEPPIVTPQRWMRRDRIGSGCSRGAAATQQARGIAMGWTVGAPGAGPENGFGASVRAMLDGRKVGIPPGFGMTGAASFPALESSRDPRRSRQRVSGPGGR